MIEEVFKYREITKSLSQEIKNSPFKGEHVIKKMGMHSVTFYRKLRLNTFTPDEILKIFSIIKPEETNDFLLKKSIERGLKDIEEGRVIDHEKMKKYIEEKYEFNL